MQRLMTAREVAEYMHIPVQMVYRKARNGDLPHYRIGRTVRFKITEIESALKSKTGGDYVQM